MLSNYVPWSWTCASRHNGVQFFISHRARCHFTRRFSEPTFQPSRPTNQWKNTVVRDFPTISRTCLFFLLTLSLSLFCSTTFLFSLTLPIFVFHLSIFSEVWLLNFFWLSDIISIFIMSTFNEGKFEGYEVATLRNSTPQRFQGSDSLRALSKATNIQTCCWLLMGKNPPVDR